LVTKGEGTNWLPFFGHQQTFYGAAFGAVKRDLALTERPLPELALVGGSSDACIKTLAIFVGGFLVEISSHLNFATNIDVESAKKCRRCGPTDMDACGASFAS
jgi:hypothetical protein